MLVVVTVVVFAQTRSFQFINYDTPDQVSANPHVLRGLTPDGVRWAFTSGETGNWIPLARLSHMLDVSLFGMEAGSHKLTSAAIHAANTVLLFLLLFAVSGYRWRSFLVALVFAVHPLHVEPVVWLNQRKELLSTFFVLLSFAAYGRYARRPGVGRYAALAGAYVCALLSKPMAITFPVLLLLVDFWPLRRLPYPGSAATGGESPFAPLASLRAAVIEKVPLFLAAIGISVISFLAQRAAGAVSELGGTISLAARLSNAVVSYGIYIRQTVWPAGLAAFYPMPKEPQTIAAVAIGAALLAGAAAAFLARSRRPYLLVGFGWFVVVLGPVIGLIRVGLAAHGDQYMYLAQTGLVVAAVWGIADLVSARPQFQRVAIAIAAAVCLALTVVSWRQLGHWRTTTTLFEHALAATGGGNPVAHNALGLELRATGEMEAAKQHYLRALATWPGYAVAHTNLGELYMAEDKLDDALAEFQAAVKSSPNLRQAQGNLGTVLRRLGRPAEAVDAFRAATRIQPDYGRSHMGLALSLEAVGRNDEAATEAATALRLSPNDADLVAAGRGLLGRLGRSEVADAIVGADTSGTGAGELHYAKGNSLVTQGRFEEAASEFRSAIDAGMSTPKVYANLGAALAQIGRYPEAVTALTEALRRDPTLVDVERNLALVRELMAKGKGG